MESHRSNQVIVRLNIEVKRWRRKAQKESQGTYGSNGYPNGMFSSIDAPVFRKVLVCREGNGGENASFQGRLVQNDQNIQEDFSILTE